MDSRNMPYKCVLLAVIILNQCLISSQTCQGPANKYVSRGEDGYLRCEKTYNCPPGYQILPCNINCGKERCVPCPSGLVQEDLIHSETNGNLSCYKGHTDCNQIGLVSSRNTGITSPSCRKIEYCKCNRNKCFFGTNPCICGRKFEYCKVNFTFDPSSRDCVPCGPGEYTSAEGCGPCYKIDPYPEIVTDVPVFKSTTTERPQNPDNENCGNDGKCQFYSLCIGSANSAKCVCPDQKSCASTQTLAVCGSDNHTYQNECLLKVKSCEQSNLIHVKYNESCASVLSSTLPTGLNTGTSTSNNNDTNDNATVLIVAFVITFLVVAVAVAVIVVLIWRRRKRGPTGHVPVAEPQQNEIENGLVQYDQLQIRQPAEDVVNNASESPIDSVGPICSRTPLLTQISHISQVSQGEKTPIAETGPPELHPFLRQNTIDHSDIGSNESPGNSLETNRNNLSSQTESQPGSMQNASPGVSIQSDDPRISDVPASPCIQVTEINVPPGTSFDTGELDSDDVAQQVKVGTAQPCENEEDTEKKREESMNIELNSRDFDKSGKTS